MRPSAPMLLGSLFSGAVVTLAIAALLPLHTPASAMRYRGWIRGGSIPWPRPVPSNWSPVPETVQEGRCFGFREVIAHEAIDGGAARPDRDCTLIVEEAGWPMLALASEYWHAPDSKGGRQFFEFAAPSWLGGRVDNVANGSIGSRLLWTGLAVNTGFFGTVFFCAFFGLHAIRNRRSQQLDSCRECGYDCRGLKVCPECGDISVRTNR